MRDRALSKSEQWNFLKEFTQSILSIICILWHLFYGIGKLKQIDFNLHNKFIKREAFIRALNSINSFYLKQYMTNFEDGIMNYILYKTSRSYYFLKNIGYFYIRNNQSITISQNI